jgi:hypothetical protein
VEKMQDWFVTVEPDVTPGEGVTRRLVGMPWSRVRESVQELKDSPVVPGSATVTVYRAEAVDTFRIGDVGN